MGDCQFVWVWSHLDMGLLTVRLTEEGFQEDEAFG